VSSDLLGGLAAMNPANQRFAQRNSRRARAWHESNAKVQGTSRARKMGEQSSH
jgi:hypothetical protein